MDDELVDPSGERVVDLKPCREDRAQQVTVTVGLAPGTGGRRGMADDGGAVVESESVAVGRNMGDEPAQASILVITAGTIGVVDIAKRARTVPVQQTSPGNGEHDTADGVGKDVRLGGQVHNATAVVETPLKTVVPGAVGADHR